jgi:hypothetical protein
MSLGPVSPLLGRELALAFGWTSWVLAGEVIVWLATVPVTLAGFVWARHELPERRTQALVDAAHAHPRLRPPPVIVVTLLE